MNHEFYIPPSLRSFAQLQDDRTRCFFEDIGCLFPDFDRRINTIWYFIRQL
jgi:hypothetical protein